MFNITTAEFWIGFGGGAFITAFIVELVKNIIFKITTKKMDTIWMTLLALPFAFPVAILFSKYLNQGEPLNWDQIPAMALLYWGTSGLWYNLVIKKFNELAKGHSDG